MLFLLGLVNIFRVFFFISETFIFRYFVLGKGVNERIRVAGSFRRAVSVVWGDQVVSRLRISQIYKIRFLPQRETRRFFLDSGFKRQCRG